MGEGGWEQYYTPISEHPRRATHFQKNLPSKKRGMNGPCGETCLGCGGSGIGRPLSRRRGKRRHWILEQGEKVTGFRESACNGQGRLSKKIGERENATRLINSLTRVENNRTRGVKEGGD